MEWVQKNPVENLGYSLMYQLTHMTYEKGCVVHDDRIDALAIACQYVSDMVLVSAESRLKDIKDKELEDWLHDRVYNKGRSTSNRLQSSSRVYR